jgi:hypothetical protein
VVVRVPTEKRFDGEPEGRANIVERTAGEAVHELPAVVSDADNRDGEVEPTAAVLPLPPRAGRVTKLVAADMALLFGLADRAGVGDVPLMYSTRWAARRLGVRHESVAYVLRVLVQHGAIVRAKSVPAWNGRSTRTYRRAER